MLRCTDRLPPLAAWSSLDIGPLTDQEVAKLAAALETERRTVKALQTRLEKEGSRAMRAQVGNASASIEFICSFT